MEPRFAELLVRGGLVSRDQLTEAQKKERENNSSITREIVRLGYTNEEALTQFLSKQFGIDSVELVPGEVEDAIFSLVPPHNLQPRDQGVLQAQWWTHNLLQHAIDTKAHSENLFIGLNMDIAAAALGGIS